MRHDIPSAAGNLFCYFDVQLPDLFAPKSVFCRSALACTSLFCEALFRKIGIDTRFWDGGMGMSYNRDETLIFKIH